MALFHLHAQVLSRANSQSAVAAAAYRHCAVMTNESYGSSHDYSGKKGNVHSEFAVPDDAPAWARELMSLPAAKASEAFWNKIECFETRYDAQLAREMTLALPVELTREQNVELVREFVRANFLERGVVADWAYHDIAGNPHVHLMSALRPLTEDGFGPKNIRSHDEHGQPKFSANGHALYHQFAGDKELIPRLREAWADVQNYHLASHGHDIRVDHRSYADQGIVLEPTMHRGPTAEGMDARGRRSDRIELAEKISQERRDQVFADPSIILRLITAEKSVFDERDVARVVHRYTDSAADFQALFLRVGALDEQVRIAAPVFDPMTGRILEREKFTTREVLDTERSMIASARALSGSAGFGADGSTVAKHIQPVQEAAGFSYDAEQKAIIARLTSDPGLAVMVGYAGAGKSTVMNGVRAVYEGHGRRVIGGALAGKAAVGLQAGAGIESRTLASWEASWRNGMRQLQAGDVFVLDEAGMVGSRQMQRFVSEVEKAGAKLILLGDARQLQPIEAGAAFRAIAEETGCIELTGVRRQHLEWMQDATVSFGRGNAEDALGAYSNNGKIGLSNTAVAARGRMIQAWFADWQAGAEVLMFAHRNVDVAALNHEARDALKAHGGLLEEFSYQTARGMRQFAIGDRVVFLEKSRELGVENGSFGTVQKAQKGSIVVALEDGRTAELQQHSYVNVDHGYAVTIHKSQGATVDASHVLASPTMDAHMAYVAMSRHRHDVHLYAGKDEFGSQELLIKALSRDRQKTTTLVYEKTDDYQQSVAEFAQRRGIAPLAEMVEMFRQELSHLGTRLAAAVTRLEAFGANIAEHLRRPIHETAQERALVVAAEVKAPSEQEHTHPYALDMSAGVRQALARLQHGLQHARGADTDRSRRRWLASSRYEMEDGAYARDLRHFMKQVEGMLPAVEAIAIGPELSGHKADALLARLPEEARAQIADAWPLLYAGQRATFDLRRVDVAKSLIRETEVAGAAHTYEKRQAEHAVPAVPYAPAVRSWPQSVEAVVSQQTQEHPLFKAALRWLEKAAAAVWQEPAAVTATLRAGAADPAGDLNDLLRRLKQQPESFGPLHGRRGILGRNDDARLAAIEAVPLVASSLQDLSRVVQQALLDLTPKEISFRQSMETPLDDLSQAARQLLTRCAEASNGSNIEIKPTDERAYRELKMFVAEARARFGTEEQPGFDQAKITRGLGATEKSPSAVAEELAQIERFFRRMARAEQQDSSVTHALDQGPRHIERDTGISH